MKRTTVRLMSNRAAGTTPTLGQPFDDAEVRSEEATGGGADLNTHDVRK